MSTVIVEQRLPIVMQIICIIPAHAQNVKSIFIAIFFWLCPSQAPQKPAVRIISPKSRKRSVHTSSSTSTLVDSTSEADSTLAASEIGEKSDIHKVAIPFTSTKVTMPSPLTRPFSRRLTLPARRLSGQITATLASPFYNYFPEEAEFNFAPQPLQCPTRKRHMPVVEVEVRKAELVEVEVNNVQKIDRVARVECWVLEHRVCVDVTADVAEAPIVLPMTPAASMKKVKGTKRVAKKAKALVRRLRPTL